jgi:hypothetical protein
VLEEEADLCRPMIYFDIWFAGAFFLAYHAPADVVHRAWFLALDVLVLWAVVRTMVVVLVAWWRRGDAA